MVKKAGRRPAYALAVSNGLKSFLEGTGAIVPYNPALTPEQAEPKHPESRPGPTGDELRALLTTSRSATDRSC